MYDLHALSSGGGTTLTNIGTILLGGDKATLAGFPVRPGATLKYWGGLTTIADTIRELQLLNEDMVQKRTGHYFILGTGGLVGALVLQTALRSDQQRTIGMRQNTAGANNIAFLLDHYPGGSVMAPPRVFSNTVVESEALAALSAITWGSIAFSPANPLPQGKYAILGAWATGLTNYGLLRFNHNDFGGLYPGFPVIDQLNTAAARAVDPNNTYLRPGLQFVDMGECPVFSVTAQGTGLNIEAAAITTDTVVPQLHLMRVA